MVYDHKKVFNFLSLIFSSLSSLLVGIVIAYFLNPLLNFFERKVFKKVYPKVKYSKLRRGLSIICVFLVVILVIFAFIMSFVPQLSESVKSLLDNYGTPEKAIASVNAFLKENRFTAPHYETIINTVIKYEDKIFSAIYSAAEVAIPLVIGYLIGLMDGIYTLVVGIIFAIYVLCYREKLLALAKKLTLAFINQKHYDYSLKILGLLDVKFGKYITGKVVDSIIVGIVSYIIYWIFGFEFYPLLALIAGVTNMIPFFGPFIGAVPAGIIVLIAQPEKLIWLLLIILVLQQLDGNILDPLIVGNEVGLIPVFTMSSTLLFGDLFGIPGMLLGVPIVATIYTLLGEAVGRRLSKKGLSDNTRDYYPEK